MYVGGKYKHFKTDPHQSLSNANYAKSLLARGTPRLGLGGGFKAWQFWMIPCVHLWCEPHEVCNAHGISRASHYWKYDNMFAFFGSCHYVCQLIQIGWELHIFHSILPLQKYQTLISHLHSVQLSLNSPVTFESFYTYNFIPYFSLLSLTSSQRGSTVLLYWPEPQHEKHLLCF